MHPKATYIWPRDIDLSAGTVKVMAEQVRGRSYLPAGTQSDNVNALAVIRVCPGTYGGSQSIPSRIYPSLLFDMTGICPFMCEINYYVALFLTNRPFCYLLDV